MVEAESTAPVCVHHVCVVVFAQDIEGEASGARHYAGITSDPALLLVAGDITNIMISMIISATADLVDSVRERLASFHRQP